MLSDNFVGVFVVVVVVVVVVETRMIGKACESLIWLFLTFFALPVNIVQNTSG